MQIFGKTAVVTGAANGIGRALAEVLAGGGCAVAICDIDIEQAEEVAAELRTWGASAEAFCCDVADYASVKKLADEVWQRFKTVDLLFNNAGVTLSAPALDATPADLDWVISVNFSGVWNGCSVFGKRFREQETESHIVNTCSEHGLGLQHSGAAFYTASKHAVLGLSEVLRAELPSHIGISVFCPGLVQSNIWDAGRNRPAHLGGAQEASHLAKAVLEQGMDAITVARHAIAAVERGDYYIVTHPHSIRAAQARWTEIQRAFEAQAPDEEGSDRYDVGSIVARLRAQTGAPS